jgi:hypothetical protein
MNVRLATPADDAGIMALLESVAMPGPIRLAFGCRPSFYQALRVEGATPVVTVAEAGGRIVGVGAVTFRQVYLNGRDATLRYLSALRIAPHARGSSAMARGFACLQEELANRPAELTLTAILTDNTAALKLLGRSRKAAPAYAPLTDCVTRVVTARQPVRHGRTSSLTVTPATDAAEVAGFLRHHGPARNFFPVCQAADLAGRPDSAFPGLAAMDFLVARNGGKIRGVLGCWDVRRFRQALVTGYSAALRWARPLVNLGARWSGRPLLPAPGQVLRLAYGTLPLVRDDDPRVLRVLLDSALEWTRQQGLDYFAVALAAGDPLAGAFHGLPCRELHSRIFRVHFAIDAAATLPDTRPQHFEAAML